MGIPSTYTLAIPSHRQPPRLRKRSPSLQLSKQSYNNSKPRPTCRIPISTISRSIFHQRLRRLRHRNDRLRPSERHNQRTHLHHLRCKLLSTIRCRIGSTYGITHTPGIFNITLRSISRLPNHISSRCGITRFVLYKSSNNFIITKFIINNNNLLLHLKTHGSNYLLKNPSSLHIPRGSRSIYTINEQYILRSTPIHSNRRSRPHSRFFSIPAASLRDNSWDLPPSPRTSRLSSNTHAGIPTIPTEQKLPYSRYAIERGFKNNVFLS